MAGPWEKYGNASAPQAVALTPPDPRRQADVAKAPIELKRAEIGLAKDQIELQRSQAEGNQPKLTEGEMKGEGFYKKALNANQMYEAQQIGPRSLAGQTMSEWAPDVLNTLPSAIGNSPSRQVADTTQEQFVTAILRQESGAAVPEPERIRYIRMYFPMPGDSKEAVEAKRQLRQVAIEGLVDASGRAITPEEQKQREQGAVVPQATIPGTVDKSRNAAEIDLGPPPPDAGFPTGEVKYEDDPQLAGVKAGYQERLSAGQSAGEIINWLRSVGVTNPGVYRSVAEQVQFRKQNPNVPIGNYNIDALDDRAIPLSATRQMMNSVANSPVGTAAINAGDAATGFNLDSLSGNPELTRLGMEQLNARNPGSAFAGQVAGGIAPMAFGQLGLMRYGMSPAAAGLTADAGYGAVAGAGANDENRLEGAGYGTLAALAGNLGGRAAAHGLASGVSPTGGPAAPLYAAGVRPSLGQRFSNSGTLGGMVNSTEEAMQSIPLVGAAVRGTRQRARDQFERGAFNQALGEIGDQLPDNMQLGTAPHRYMQQAFDRAYDTARGGMGFVADQQWGQDLQQFAPTFQALSEDSQRRLTGMINRHLSRRIRNGNGAMNGDAFKAATSDLQKESRRIRNNPNGDYELAEAIDDLVGIVDQTARRNSAPEAAAALDRADRGYAMAVRIEHAAANRGGDTGRFSPNQFDRAVQRDSGGTRSREYLRGDALMGDYAESGKMLSDKMGDSGSAPRVLTATALTGTATAIKPPFAALLGALTTPYLPGVRRLSTGAIAPRGPGAARAAAAIRSQAGTAGRIGAAGSVPLIER